MKITPTVGRVVWFYPAANLATSGFTPPSEGEPLAAIIARVVDADAGAVHLAVFDGAGVSRSEPYVKLVQEGEKVPADGRYAAWMPYQIGQAKKAEDRDHDATQLAAASDRAADDRRMRAGILDMALRTPGLNGHDDVLTAARAYQAHIEGAAQPTGNQQPTPGAAHAGYSALQPHQQRVVDEAAELDSKSAKLLAFFDTATFAGLDEAEQSRLRQQSHAMACYLAILGERIAAFTPAAPA